MAAKELLAQLHEVAANPRKQLGKCRRARDRKERNIWKKQSGWTNIWLKVRRSLQ